MASATSDAPARGALPRAATGALSGPAGAGRLGRVLSPATAFAVLALGALLGAATALAVPGAEALHHPLLATVAALAGVSMTMAPEPAFFLLVPLLAAGIAWPLASTA